MSVDRVYTFECSLQSAGQNLSVAGLTVDIPLNGIPTIEFNIDPFHAKGTPPTKAFTPTLAHYFTGPIPNALYDIVKKSVQDATLDLKVKSSKGDDDQNLKCSGWVPVGAGYNEASSINMSGFSFTIAHPLVRAERSSTIIASVGKFTPYVQSTLEGASTPFLQFIINTLTTRIAGGGIDPMMPVGADALKDMNARAQEAIKIMDSNLKWESGTPNTYKNGLLHRRALVSLANRLFSSEVFTPLQAVVGLLCPNFFIRMAPDPTDLNQPLVLAPLEPWGAVGITLADREVSRLQPAPTVFNPISGVAFTQDNFKEMAYAKEYGKIEQWAVVEPTDFSDSDKYPVGALKAAEMPPWIRNYATASNTPPPRYTVGAWPGTDAIPESQEKPMQEYLIGYVDVLRDFLQSTLQIQHLVDKTVTLYAKLMISKDGKLVRPGGVYRVTGEFGESLFYFYCTRVRHRINVSTSEAYTVLQGGYFRSNRGGSFEFTKASGSMCPLFAETSSGKSATSGASITGGGQSFGNVA